MNDHLNLIESDIFEKCNLLISAFKIENESTEYEACRFKLSGLHIVYRKAKITPKKIGHFVTFWKRNKNGETAPLDETDPFDFYVIKTGREKQLGQFVFPKSILIKKGIVSTRHKKGKRGFRVYPSWDQPSSLQAKRTQSWQSNYFFEINDKTDLKKVLKLYCIK